MPGGPSPVNDAQEQLVYTFGLGESPSSPATAEILGGKGASLAEMIRKGFPVPPGFTISIRCCAWAEQHGGTWPHGLEQQVRAAIGKLESKTDRTFGRGPRPVFVAVRSGAAVSMPGMMDTILNCGMNPAIGDSIPGREQFWKDYADHIRMFSASVAGIKLQGTVSPDPEFSARSLISEFEVRTGRAFPVDPWESLFECIRAVFTSWNSERARTYRQHHDIRGVMGTAVNIQAMFPSERSGVLFTANPQDPDAGEMVIEASWGLGEAVVSGATTPDIYVVDSKTLLTRRVVPGVRPGTDPALSADEVHEIAALGRRIEQEFGVASDIEWGIADGQIALLQTRKIRGLEIVADVERARRDEIQRLRELSSDRPAVWVIHNLAETLPAPTPLTWDLVRWFMSAQGGYGQLYRLLGHRPSERIPGHGFLELVAGRIYVDPRRAAEFHFGRLPIEYDEDEILRDRSALERPPTRFNVDLTDSFFFLRLPGLLLNLLRSARRTKVMARAPEVRFERMAVPKLESFLAQIAETDLPTVATAELLRELERRRDFVLGEFAASSLLPGFFGGIAHEESRRLLTQLLGPEEGERVTGQLTTGLEGDVTVEQNIALFEIAQGHGARADFLRRYGHRAINEMELSKPRWNEDPDFVDRMIERFRSAACQSPDVMHSRQIAVRRQAEIDLPSRLAAAGGSSLRERVEGAIRRAQRLVPYRELGKFHLMRGYQTLREILVELGRRWDLGRDIFFLHFGELFEFESKPVELRQLIQTRKLRWRSSQKLVTEDVIDSRNLEHFGQPRVREDVEDDAPLTCQSIAAGHGRGTARIVFHPDQVTDLGQDYVLVCPSTDPGWTPLFVHARGLIVERGGMLSHGAIVARDFGIPAVVLEQATRIIPEGSQIEIDADRGRVFLRTGKQRSAIVPADRSSLEIASAAGAGAQ